ncbi:ATP-dependent Clp protease ATP-binding subunit [Kribbella sp. NBC_01245]|uniref:Clp protease N-terminal domain-containing protein n=1 Tax=Kribbella sp. NBC_01245 TaxID=2903578 RepID=UPI002E2A0697|nr:Clp protease N-terminal domain-containing protein [Kribbella sp. NBC_01245]
MTPGPNLQELVDTIRQDAGSDDELAQLATAATEISELTATGDAALGYFVDRARAAGKSWVEISAVLGVSKQAAHKRFAVSWASQPAFDRYTERTRRAVEAASGIAVAANHNYIGTEHLLLAFFTEPECIGAKVLAAADITEEAVGTAVTALIPPGANQVQGEPPMTPRASHVLQGAVAEALELGHNYIGTEHILLSFYRDSGGVAAKVLRELGLSDEAARAAVIEALTT